MDAQLVVTVCTSVKHVYIYVGKLRWKEKPYALIILICPVVNHDHLCVYMYV